MYKYNLTAKLSKPETHYSPIHCRPLAWVETGVEMGVEMGVETGVGGGGEIGPRLTCISLT